MNSRRLAFLGLAVLLGAGTVLSLVAAERSSNGWRFALNLLAELVGALALYVLLDRTMERTAVNSEQRVAELQRIEAEREAERQRIAREKAKLVDDMGSRTREVAVAAIAALSEKAWLYDGSLSGAYLATANLREADLARAALEGADLHRAELGGASLQVARLPEADLSFANLEGAQVVDANLTRSDLSFSKLAGATLENANATRSDLSFAALTGANLGRANLTRSSLRHADLTGANLQGASLVGADLQFAHLTHTRFDETTELPDGSTWTEHSDLARFTYPKHAEFWRSDDPVSPAYRGQADVRSMSGAMYRI
jgi:uncharacterized protein YjbI with pentapeptide repeats